MRLFSWKPPCGELVISALFDEFWEKKFRLYEKNKFSSQVPRLTKRNGYGIIIPHEKSMTAAREKDMVTHKGTQKLTTERLVLRPFRAEDAEWIHRYWTADEELSRWLPWIRNPEAEETAENLSKIAANYRQPDYYNWVIEADRVPIGNITVTMYTQRSAWCSIGYCMEQRWRNRGMMTEAVRCICSFLLGAVGFHRIVIEHTTDNPASGRVARKAGFTLEGIQRQKQYSPETDEYLDVALWSRLETDDR